MDFDTTVKLNIYASIASTAQIPSAPEVARALDAPWTKFRLPSKPCT